MFPIFQCSECDKMSSIDSLSLKQNQSEMEQLKCVHSVVANILMLDWGAEWDIPDIDYITNSLQLNIMPEIECEIYNYMNHVLSVTRQENKISILFTVTQKQKIPFCSLCFSRKCKCYRIYKVHMKSLEENEVNLMESDDEDEIENVDDNEEQQNNYVDVDEEEDDAEEHYDDPITYDDHINKFGYNHTKVTFPYDENMRRKYMRRKDRYYDLPADGFKPTYYEVLQCKHNISYNPDDQSLFKITSKIVIFTEDGNLVENISNFGRPSLCQFNCAQQTDTTEFLLWNLGGGQFMNYKFLYNHILDWHASGTTKQSAWQSRENFHKSLSQNQNENVKLSKQNFNRACNGFVRNHRIEHRVFICPECGESPKYLAADGTATGPAKRQIKQKTELAKSSMDNEVLEQGSCFNDRIYLPYEVERKLVKDLATGQIDMNDFIRSGNIVSDGGKMLQILIRRLNRDHPQKLPKEYLRLLSNIGKTTPVAGFIQPTGPDSLVILMKFAKQELSLRKVGNIEKLCLVKTELPVFWNILLDILNFEITEFLPPDVAKIVRALLRIRNITFTKAAKRSEDSYKPWGNPNKEHPHAFYPNFPLLRYPKQYKVREHTHKKWT